MARWFTGAPMPRASGRRPLTVTGAAPCWRIGAFPSSTFRLRRRLGPDGSELESTGDTAVMLRTLGLHGPAAVGWLRGMFAFAMWDADTRLLRLARDPLGIKPLYLTRNRDPAAAWSVAFASEVRALLASGLLGTPRLDPQAVASTVWNGFVVGPGTAVSGVELLWPGRLLEFDARGRETRCEDFWMVPAGPRNGAPDDVSLADVLEEDVRLHLASDVPLAVFLSGGVDSSVVANLAQRAQRTPSTRSPSLSRSKSSTKAPSLGGSPRRSERSTPRSR